MKTTINQNIQPIVYTNKTFPLTFAYVLAQSAIINANQPIPDEGNITENPDFCLPKGLSVRLQGQTTSATKNVTSMTRSGSTVTVTSNAHSLTTGTSIQVTGASPTAYNGTFQITVTGANTFTYTVGSSGNDTASGNIVLTASISTTSNVKIDPDRLVWIVGKGAYETKEGAWVPVPEVTNLLNNSTKLYTTDENGSYLVFDMTDITDPFNQIKTLKSNEGYLVISNKAGIIPDYEWYIQEIEQDAKNLEAAKVSFIYRQCATTIEANNNQKVIKLIDIEGSCNQHHKAGATLKVKLYQLKQGLNYKVVFKADNNESKTVFENDELYYGNNQLEEIYINNDIDVFNNLINSVLTLDVLLYENDQLISRDSLSLYIDCPAPPVTVSPPLIKPRFYLIGED
jgi:hypothetical protein